MFCFNADPQMVSGLSIAKIKTEGEYKIKFIEAAFHKEAYSCEFFIEFEEQIWSHTLAEALEEKGARQVHIETFKHNDGNDSASNALLRVWLVAEQTGLHEIRGKCSDSLLKKTKVKQAQAKVDAMKQKNESEFDEKTQAAIKLSMQNMEGKIDNVDDKIDHVVDDMIDVKDTLSNVETCACRTCRTRHVRHASQVLRGDREAQGSPSSKDSRL